MQWPRGFKIRPQVEQSAGEDARAFSLLRVNRRGNLRSLTNVGYFDYKWTERHPNLAEDFPDADPYGVLVLPGHTYVADAGLNTLDEVMADGSVRVLAYFPNEILSDAVPTCIAQGPDGLLYVGTLASVDTFSIGPSAKVYQLDPAQANLKDPRKTPLTVWASGLWPINGCAFGPDGSLYVSQLFTNPDFLNDFENPLGDVAQIPFSDPATHNFLTGGALSWTGGVAVDAKGTVYVADGTAFVADGAGRVMRLIP